MLVRKERHTLILTDSRRVSHTLDSDWKLTSSNIPGLVYSCICNGVISFTKHGIILGGLLDDEVFIATIISE